MADSVLEYDITHNGIRKKLDAEKLTVGMQDVYQQRVQVWGRKITVKTVALTASGNVHVPATGKKIRLYKYTFSLSADMTDVAFRFGSAGPDFYKQLKPASGGLYGSNLRPDFIEGAVDEPLFCAITGIGTVQTNIEFLEV